MVSAFNHCTHTALHQQHKCIASVILLHNPFALSVLLKVKAYLDGDVFQFFAVYTLKEGEQEQFIVDIHLEAITILIALIESLTLPHAQSTFGVLIDEIGFQLLMLLQYFLCFFKS